MRLFDSAHAVTGGAIAIVLSTSAEAWVKVMSAAVPAAVAVAYTIWKWWRDARKDDKRRPWE